jgi:hypothetical protein
MGKRRIISQGSRLSIGHVAVGALLLVALGTVAWAGGDPWKTKPFDQWTQKEVSEILHNSPWAKVENVPADWKPSQYSAANTQGGLAPKTGPGAAPSMGGAPAGAAGTNGGAARAPGQDQEQNGASQGQVTYYLRWNSSRTVREALVRDAILSGKIQESEAEKYLSAPITDYQVLVVGSDMTPFQHSTPDEVKAKSFLRGEESKVEVNPTDVKIVPSPEGSEVTAVLFTFSRKAADSKDVAAPKEKGLRFECKLKDLDLRTTFDPRKMADSKGPDF